MQHKTEIKWDGSNWYAVCNKCQVSHQLQTPVKGYNIHQYME